MWSYPFQPRGRHRERRCGYAGGRRPCRTARYEKTASSLAMGNMQMGSASLNNVIRHHEGVAVDMNPNLRRGNQYQARGIEYSNFSGGGFVVNRRKVKSVPTWRSTIPWVQPRRELRTSSRQQQRLEYAESALAIKQEAGFERATRKRSDTTGYRHGTGSPSRRPMKPCAR